MAHWALVLFSALVHVRVTAEYCSDQPIIDSTDLVSMLQVSLKSGDKYADTTFITNANRSASNVVVYSKSLQMLQSKLPWIVTGNVWWLVFLGLAVMCATCCCTCMRFIHRVQQDRCMESSEITVKGWSRWMVLILTCLGLFGQFYVSDIPSALNEDLKLHMSTLSPGSAEHYDSHFNLLYLVYSLPNIVLPLVLGIAVDKYGCRPLIGFLGLCVVLGHILFTTGVCQASWPSMIAGRFLFGIGGGSMQIAQTCLLLRWFKGNEVAIAFGLNIAVAKSGSMLNDVLSPHIARWWGVVGAMWLGAALCLISLICNVLSTWLDTKADLPRITNVEEVSLREDLSISRVFWAMIILCLLFYCGIMPIACAFFEELFFTYKSLAYAQHVAGNALSVMFLVSTIGMPPYGVLVDMGGMRTQFLFICSGLLAVIYVLDFSLPPVISIFGLGLMTIFASAFWPNASLLVVPFNKLGTAGGVATALQNGGSEVVPMLVRQLHAAAGPGHLRHMFHLAGLFGLVGMFVANEIVHTKTAGKGMTSRPSKFIEQHPNSLDEVTQRMLMSSTSSGKVREDL